MRTITKLAPTGFHGQRTSLGDMVGTIKRVCAIKSDRRPQRPLQDIDGWSDQAEVAFYEDCRLSRCV